jgi:hypothetical protein
MLARANALILCLTPCELSWGGNVAVAVCLPAVSLDCCFLSWHRTNNFA